MAIEAGVGVAHSVESVAHLDGVSLDRVFPAVLRTLPVVIPVSSVSIQRLVAIEIDVVVAAAAPVVESVAHLWEMENPMVFFLRVVAVLDLFLFPFPIPRHNIQQQVILDQLLFLLSSDRIVLLVAYWFHIHHKVMVLLWSPCYLRPLESLLMVFPIVVVVQIQHVAVILYYPHYL